MIDQQSNHARIRLSWRGDGPQGATRTASRAESDNLLIDVPLFQQDETLLMGEHSPRYKLTTVRTCHGKIDFEDDRIKYCDRCEYVIYSV